MPRRFEVAEMSMAPSFLPRDLLVAVSLREPVRGAPVVFEHPRRPAFWLLKRIVGLPGERVDVADDGAVAVDGSTLDEPWAVGRTSPPASFAVPAGSVFVLSDAREHTRADSRTFGPVALRSAFRVAFTYWPPRRAGRPHLPRAGPADSL